MEAITQAINDLMASKYWFDVRLSLILFATLVVGALLAAAIELISETRRIKKLEKNIDERDRYYI